MHKLNSKLLMATALAAALMAGCGGGGGGGGGTAFTFPPATTAPGTGGGGAGGGGTVADISKSVADLFAYLSNLIAGTSDSSDPVDINALTLATDDAAEPTPLN